MLAECGYFYETLGGFMKRTKLALLVLGIMMLTGCIFSPDDTGTGDGNDGVETWEFLPFYGETRFLIVQDGTDTPIPDASLQVENLFFGRVVVLGQDDENYLRGDQYGRITIHQLQSRDAKFKLRCVSAGYFEMDCLRPTQPPGFFFSHSCRHFEVQQQYNNAVCE